MAANSLFALFAVSAPEAMVPRLEALAPWLSLKVGEAQWLIVAPSTVTTKELSERLEIGREGGTGILVRVENYWGNTNKSVWEWISAKSEVPFDTTA